MKRFRTGWASTFVALLAMLAGAFNAVSLTMDPLSIALLIEDVSAIEAAFVALDTAMANVERTASLLDPVGHECDCARLDLACVRNESVAVTDETTLDRDDLVSGERSGKPFRVLPCTSIG